MFKTCLLVMSMVFALPAAAQIYEWKDAEGRLNYSDRPPPGVSARMVKPAPIPGIAPQPTAQPSTQERLQEMQEQRLSAQEARATEEQERTRAAEVERSCAQARNQLAALESGQRISRFNAQGEREYLDDGARKAETERTRNFIESRCK